MTEPTLTTAELKLLAQRERKAQDKRAWRERKAQERAQSALAPNPGGYVTPRAPVHPGKLRKWLRDRHQDYAQRRIGIVELTECRRTAAGIGDLHKAESTVRGADAALRAAEAQERIADALGSLEHGGAAAMFLARLRGPDGLYSGQRRPLPRPMQAVSPTTEGSP
jgi:hypothetical protein